MIRLNDQISLNSLSLNFNSPKVEKEFRSAHAINSLRPLRLIFTVGTVLYLIMIFRDWMFNKPGAFFIEYFMVTPTLIMNLLLTFSPRTHRYMLYGISLTATMMTIGNIYSTYIIPDSPIYLITTYVTMIFCVFTVARLFLMYAVTTVFIISAVFAWAELFLFKIPFEDFTYQFMAIVIADACGFVAGYTIEYHMRREFFLAQQLNVINTELEAANKMKTEFLGIAAHDLKNPLTAMVGFADLVLENPSLTGEIRKDIEMIRKSSDRMKKIIFELLTVSAIQAGTISTRMNDVDLSHTMRLMIAQLQSLAERKRQRITQDIEEGIILRADEEKLKSIIENLLSNAIKFSATDKTVGVFLHQRNGVARLLIDDEGPGIPPEEMDQLFKKWQKLSARPTHNESSTGLGLSIAKTFVELHQGKIWAENKPDGAGSRFIVELPIT